MRVGDPMDAPALALAALVYGFGFASLGRWLARHEGREAGTTTTRGDAPMLVLSRHRDESVIIGDDVVVTVLSITRDVVRLGIQAPAHISVDRFEVRAAKEQAVEERAYPRDGGKPR
jgi:carbon storage regulator